MKSYDYEAIIVDSEIYCTECRSKDISIDDPALSPIFADSEWNYYPVCCVCGYEHDYVTKLED